MTVKKEFEKKVKNMHNSRRSSQTTLLFDNSQNHKKNPQMQSFYNLKQSIVNKSQVRVGKHIGGK